MKRDNKVNPCRKCGSKDIHTRWISDKNVPDRINLLCMECGNEGRVKAHPQDALYEWNRENKRLRLIQGGKKDG